MMRNHRHWMMTLFRSEFVEPDLLMECKFREITERMTIWPDEAIIQCPHCHYEANEHKFILIDGSLECPLCCEPIIQRKEEEDG